MAIRYSVVSMLGIQWIEYLPAQYHDAVSLLDELDNHPWYKNEFDRNFLQNVVNQQFVSPKQAKHVTKIALRVGNDRHWKAFRKTVRNQFKKVSP